MDIISRRWILVIGMKSNLPKTGGAYPMWNLGRYRDMKLLTNISF